jgi:hypothetical protein
MRTEASAAGLGELHPVELLLLLGLAVVLAVRELTVALIGLAGAAAGWRAPMTPATAPAAVELAPAAPMAHPIGDALAELGALTVRELRAMAREAGHRQLARNGRRADLLAALGAI